MRKRRHPHQVMGVADLAAGGVYAFVTSWGGQSDTYCTMRVVGAVLPDTMGLAKRRGVDPSVLRCDEGGPTIYQKKLPLATLLDDIPRVGAEILTVHMDGWSEMGDTADHPTLSYWQEGDHAWRGWDKAITYLGPSEPQPRDGAERHCIVVPDDRWLADPVIHMGVADPDGETAAEFERRMRAKRDAEMSRFFSS